MPYFSELNGMRTPIEHTSTISIEMYSLLFDCCTNYYDNIACKFPLECPDGNGCCGLDLNKFSTYLTFEIPSLFKNNNGVIDKPHKDYFGDDEYDQYALLDLIELIAQNCTDISHRFWHTYFRHYDLTFTSTRYVFSKFRNNINKIFEKTGLLYTLTENGSVERVIEHGVLSKNVEETLSTVSEDGTKELLEEAITLFKQPQPTARKDAVEKIWDALERLKTYYTSLDKKSSVTKIVEDMSNGKSEFIILFNNEFKALTSIGNDFRIRHHETSKIDISDTKHYDYFFNRCLSLIDLAIQYLH